MKGDSYHLVNGVNGARVGSMVIGDGGYVAKNDAEASELDLYEYVVCHPAADTGKETREQLNERAAAAGVETPEKLKSKQAVLDALAEVTV